MALNNVLRPGDVVIGPEYAIVSGSCTSSAAELSESLSVKQKLPMADTPDVDVHEVRAAIVPQTAYHFHLDLLRPELFGWLPQSLLGSSRGRRRYVITYERFVIPTTVSNHCGSAVGSISCRA